MTNFEEFKKPLPTDPDEISKGIDELLKPAKFFVPRDEEDRDEADKKIREIGSKKAEPLKLPTLEEAVSMTPEQEEAFHEMRRGQGKEEAPSIFPDPYTDDDINNPDSETERSFKKIMRESQLGEVSKQSVEEEVREIVDPNFSDRRMLFRNVLNFWPLKMDNEQYASFSSDDLGLILAEVPHYREGYEKDNLPGDLYTKRIIELSDPNQVRKYDQLVDEFNADRERIIKERDFISLQKFFERAKSLVDEKK